MQQMEEGASGGKIACLYMYDGQNHLCTSAYVEKDKYRVELKIPSFSLCYS